jgi:NADH-quinone oxidoreductase subunit A
MPALVGYLLLFVGVAIFFVFFHLVLGRLLRPVKPDPEKLTIYECGEPTIGSAWVQFDLRFYVVALLFVIFDVEVAFFFPWAVVFGTATELGRADLTPEQRVALTRELAPQYHEARADLLQQQRDFPADDAALQAAVNKWVDGQVMLLDREVQDSRLAARQLAWFALWDILVFFGVLLVGFAYLWKRGDLDWVRSLAAERAAAGRPSATDGVGELVGAGRGTG